MSARMIDQTVRTLGTLWVGVMAGFFFAFSVLVMPGLDQTDPLAAMAAMQAINDAVGNAAFGLGFFGAALLCLAVAGVAFVKRSRPGWLGLAAAALYLIGVFGVTVGFNVPLNDDLAVLDPTLAANAPAMTDYISDWTVWNHVRTLAAIAAFGLLVVSLLLDRSSADGPS